MRAPSLLAEAQAADAIRRGAMRLLLDLDLAAIPEVTLPNGRRADLVAVGAGGELTLVEIKSSREDFLTDRKWPDYLGFADLFYFAVAPDFPLELLPADEGLILADRFAGAIHRPARKRPVEPARRKSLLLRFARLGALRLHGAMDPEALAGRLDG
ncbi:MAG: MmcB family DNA repair protein [Geminicoccaceae bacterium]